MFAAIFQALIPIIFLSRGVRLRFYTPPFNKQAKGFSTWRTRENERDWIMGNRYAGSINMIEGFTLGVICLIKFILYPETYFPTYNYVYTGACIVCILTQVPIVHFILTKKFGPGADSYHDRLSR